tara:strand:- start:988 stop:1368 length:381 start_codon:yes stop_codon:yes gene_type:complete
MKLKKLLKKFKEGITQEARECNSFKNIINFMLLLVFATVLHVFLLLVKEDGFIGESAGTLFIISILMVFVVKEVVTILNQLNYIVAILSSLIVLSMFMGWVFIYQFIMILLAIFLCLSTILWEGWK